MSKSRIALLAVLICASGVQAAERKWQLEREEEGIKVYLADVPGSKYKAYRGVVTIDADLPKVLALQEDIPGACAWVYSCQEQRLLQREGDKSWLYTQFKMPWPVEARDSVIEVTTRKEADGSVTRMLEGDPGRLPKVKGYVRVPSLEGEWLLKPEGEHRVEVIYEAHTEPGGSVPSWLANSFVVDAPLQTLKALRAKAEAK
ncbi:START domain-containing protein [Pseudomonas sp. NCHU5208]|uniref:START domain-containing protein n=1 Tax=unclassified Pseudomonas TaxID=196821 RepID=UPI003F94E41D